MQMRACGLAEWRSEQTMRISLAVGLCLLAAATLSLRAMAQTDDYPNRPLRMVLPFPPGGSTDRIGRLVADKMSAGIKQPVVVDYRPGAGGNIGIGTVAKAAPDGYTILLCSSTISVSPSMYRKLDYDTQRDLVPIGLAAKIPSVVVVHPSVPVKTMKELIELARQHPNKLNYGSGGVGTTNHLATELLLSMAKIKVVHVPYKSTAQALLQMLAGESDLVVISTTAAIPQIRAGKLRALAVLRPERIPVLPMCPRRSRPACRDGRPTPGTACWGGLEPRSRFSTN
jgi:tripartite-type tricarboxylate transporter receptor subunit TctC